MSSAITQANADGSGFPTTITFTCSGTIIFPSRLSIEGNIIIKGGGSVIFDGNGTTQLFRVPAFLTLDGVTVQNGYSNGDGGAIIAPGLVNIVNSTFQNNEAIRSGGAIYNDYEMTITNSIFRDNIAGLHGGAVFTNSIREVDIRTSTFNDNQAILGDGGAIYTNYTLDSINNVFYQNSATQGGAIFVDALYTGSSAIITHNTFVNNSVDTIYVQFNIATITRSILFGSGTLCENSNGTLNVNDTNLANSACGNAIIVTDLGLGTFDGRIVPLLAGSPALDAYPTPCAVTNDRLNIPRSQGSMCDIGASEVPHAPIVSTCTYASLSFAVATANVTGEPVTFTCSGTITFGGFLTISGNVIINGLGNITFNGNNTQRFFTINKNASLTLNGLTFINGSGTTGDSGAIYNEGNLTIMNSTFNNNNTRAIYAKGNTSIINSIFNNNFFTINSWGLIYSDGHLTITSSTFDGNTVSLIVGIGVIVINNSIFTNNSKQMIFATGNNVFSPTSLTVTDSFFNNNVENAIRASTNLEVQRITITINNSTFSNHSASVIHTTTNEYIGIHTTINNSTFSNNTNRAIYAQGRGLLAINNNTFTNNSVVSGNGGAIYFDGYDGSTNSAITNSTFANNSTSNGLGGAIYLESTDGIRSFKITNSTFSNNSASIGGAIYSGRITQVIHNTFIDNINGTIYATSPGSISASANIFDGTGTLCSGQLNINNTNFANSVCGNATVVADLGLGAFDGRVVSLLPTSPAVDAYSAPCAVATDQLGNPRPQALRCDAGALEIVYELFNEQHILATMQAQAISTNATLYPLVLDVVTNGMEITIQDNTGQIGTARLTLTFQNNLLQIIISQTTGSFSDTIHAELPQLVTLSLDALFTEFGVVNSRIRQFTTSSDALLIEFDS